MSLLLDQYKCDLKKITNYKTWSYIRDLILLEFNIASFWRPYEETKRSQELKILEEEILNVLP